MFRLSGDDHMAEQFLSRLGEIEKSIGSLGETLKRMITILGAVSEIKSELKVTKDEMMKGIKSLPQKTVTKDEIMEAFKSLPQPAPTATTESTLSREEVAEIVQAEIETLRTSINESLSSLRDDFKTLIEEIPQPAPPVAPVAVPIEETPVTEAPDTPIVVTPAVEEPAAVTISADRAMKVANQLETILGSLKMGCKAGDVLNQMNEAKAEIMKIVPSDPIMVKIDKWAGLIGGYQKRKELQARDILKLKKGLRAEIKKYQPA